MSVGIDANTDFDQLIRTKYKVCINFDGDRLKPTNINITHIYDIIIV